MSFSSGPSKLRTGVLPMTRQGKSILTGFVAAAALASFALLAALGSRSHAQVGEAQAKAAQAREAEARAREAAAAKAKDEAIKAQAAGQAKAKADAPVARALPAAPAKDAD